MSASRVSVEIRRLVRNYANGCCEYCKSRDDCGSGSFNVEHILPAARSGSNELLNLAWSCSGCNSHKFVKIIGWDAVSEKLVPLFNPRSQQWPDHFYWDETLTQILGKTPTCRATIYELKMNRQQLINLRKGMILLGIHPPVDEV